MSSAQHSEFCGSNFSSALKRPPVFGTNANLQTSQMINDTSSLASQITYEDGFPNAEYNAITEEDKARRRKEDKENKMKDFMNKTKKNAQAKLQNEQVQKQQALEKQAKDKERLLKAKDYAKKQREIVSKKKGNVTVLTTDEPAAGEHTNYHAQIKSDQQQYVMSNRDYEEPI